MIINYYSSSKFTPNIKFTRDQTNVSVSMSVSGFRCQTDTALSTGVCLINKALHGPKVTETEYP